MFILFTFFSADDRFESFDFSPPLPLFEAVLTTTEAATRDFFLACFAADDSLSSFRPAFSTPAAIWLSICDLRLDDVDFGAAGWINGAAIDDDDEYLNEGKRRTVKSWLSLASLL